MQMRQWVNKRKYCNDISLISSLQYDKFTCFNFQQQLAKYRDVPHDISHKIAVHQYLKPFCKRCFSFSTLFFLVQNQKVHYKFYHHKKVNDKIGDIYLGKQNTNLPFLGLFNPRLGFIRWCNLKKIPIQGWIGCFEILNLDETVAFLQITLKYVSRCEMISARKQSVKENI